MAEPKPRILTLRYWLLMLSGLSYFAGMSIMFPVLPDYVKNQLGGSDLQVGLSVGIAGFSSAVLMLLTSQICDIKGRRWTILFGAIASSVGMFGLLLASNIPLVVGFRLINGLGEATFFVGLAAAFQDLTPEGRRAESASYFSAAVYVGFALGPIIGEQLSEQFSFGAAWVGAGLFCAAAACLSLKAPNERRPNSLFRPGRLIHPAAASTSAVGLLGLIGYASFITFAAVWATEIGIGRTGSVFLTFSCVVMVLRVGLAKVPDRLGARTTSTIALATSMVALATMALWHSPAGLFTGTILLGFGQSFFFPALFSLTISGASAEERGKAMGTFCAAFEISLTVGAILAGAVSDNLGGISSAFWMGSMTCALALIVGITLLPRQQQDAKLELRES